MLVYWGLYHVGIKQEPRLITPDVMSPTGYVRRPLLFKVRFHLWDYPQDFQGRVNEIQLGLLWVYVSRMPLVSILEASLEDMVGVNSIKGSHQVALGYMVTAALISTIKSRGGVIIIPEDPNMFKIEVG